MADTRYSPIADELGQRLAQAVGQHDPSFEDRELIRHAYEGVPDDKMDNVKFGDLSDEVQAAVRRCEALPPTSWEDPTDAPDDVD